MLSEERNRLLCQTGPGTPMGELLRRYWHPVAGAAEFAPGGRTVKPVRILGEDLTLYRGKGGAYGLVDRHCPHRRADTSYGFVEECGLRCNYHGWLFGPDGRCLHQPFEETRHPEGNFKDKVRIKAYPVREKAGLLWAYLGPQPAPELPDWDRFHARGFKQIAISEVPCNWLQCQENSIDPVHFEWLHDNWGKVLRGEDGPRAPSHRRLGFDEFDYGFVYRRVREDTTEDHELWTTGRACLWPNCLYTGHFEWRVPIDDENTLSVGWFIDELPGEAPFEQDVIPAWDAPVKDPETGRWISSHIMNQDFIAWLGQGVIADRSREHLGESDRGVILIRKRFLDDLEAIKAGRDPMALIRDASVNDRVPLPIIERQPAPDGPRPFPFLAGQPAEVREELQRVWRVCEAPRESDVRLPTHTVRVLEWGPAGGPLVVALHGFPDTAWTWRRLAPLLAAEGYRVAAPFLRGYAPSGIPSDGDYSVRALAADAAALHGLLGGDDRAVLVGHDWGAIAGAAVAGDPASPYRRVAVLAVPPLSLMSPARESLPALARQPFRSWYIGFNQVPGLAESSFGWLAGRLWRAWSPGYDPAGDLALLRDAVPTRAHARAVVSYYRALRGKGARPAMKPPASPLLYLHGERDGCLDPGFFPVVAARLPPDSPAALIPGAGHFLHLEQPDVIAGRLLAFLDGEQDRGD